MQLTVAVAASAQLAFQEMGSRFQEQTDIGVTLTIGSSGLLAQQIENGAPYDVYAAANSEYMEQLQEKGLILPETKQHYGQGRIVLAVYRESGIEATRLEDLRQAAIGHIAIANPEHAPYGMAAMQALQSSGLWETLRPKLVYGENVRQATQFVQTGNAEVGILPLVLADAPETTYALLDASLHEPLDQTMAVVKGTQHPVEAKAFLDFVNGPAGREIMGRHGFLLPDEL